MAGGRLLPSGAWTGSLCCALLALTAACGGAAAAQTWQEAVDYTKLQARVGASLVTGSGGAVSLVEAQNANHAYYLDATGAEFTAPTDPFSQALSLTDGSGAAGNGTTGHATSTVGANFFGNSSSMAPGANTVTIYEVNHWLDNVLRYNNSGAPPLVQPFRVQNHSWIAPTIGNDNQDAAILRRYDYLIETGELTAVVGANNYIKEAPQHPNLMVHSYNAIVAGRSDGRHSRGQTNNAYGAGRYRPDLVSPATVTSAATARVSSAAAMLHENGAGTDAVRAETMKATLMAGATKPEFADFVDSITGTANPWDRTPTRPLDDVFGAGELNVYNSYLIQMGGRHAGSATAPIVPVGSFGWDYQDRKNDAAVGDIFYKFQIPAGSTAQELSIMLAWNAKITDTNPSSAFSPTESLQNLDLRLYTSAEGVLGEPVDPLRTSVSTADNVEHIYLTNLGPGDYTLKVSGAANWDYGLAWRMTTAFDQISADFDDDGYVTGSDFLTWQRNFGTLLGASHGQGDADGDGDVDGDDLSAFNMGAGASSVAQFATGLSTANTGGWASLGGAVGAVPEPGTIGSLAAGLLLLAAGRAMLPIRRTGRRSRRG